MSIITISLYAAYLGLWVWCVHREGGIGIGVRFMYAFNVSQLFLVGPPLYALSGLADADVRGYGNREAAVQLVLYSMLGFVVGAYFLTPIVMGRLLHMEQAWKPFCHPL